MIKRLLPLFVVIGVSFWSVWPLVRCGSCVADYGKDGELITWIINTAGKNFYGLHSDINKGLFNGNIFYPYSHVLAYSDMFFITGMWTYPINILTHNPGIVNLIAEAVGQVATMLVMYFWWANLTKNKWAAMIGTTAFGLSQIRMEYQVHLQMWGMQYMLIATWLIVSWLEDRKNWKLYLGVGMLGLQIWESLLPIYFAGVIILCWIILNFKFLILNKYLNAQILKKIIFAGLFFCVVAALPLSAYWGVGREFHYQRDIREAANNSISINDIWGKFGSPGLYVLLVVAVIRIFNFQFSIFNQFSMTKLLNINKNVWWLVLVLFASLIMAMGPALKLQGKTVKIGGKISVPLPYAAAYYLVPGFGAFRTPSRWIWVAGWAASGLIAVGISTTLSDPPPNLGWGRKGGGIRKGLGVIGLLLVAIIGGMRITNVRKLPGPDNMPEVYKWLAKQPGRVVLEIPMGDENIETDRMVYSLFHSKTLVNGFSGFTPPGYYQMAKWVNDGLTWEEMGKLKKRGVDYIIVNNSKLISLK